MSVSFWISISIYISSIIILSVLGLFKKKLFQTIGLWGMIGGIVFLCQPFFAVLFQYGIAVLILGLIYWNFGNNMKEEVETEKPQ